MATNRPHGPDEFRQKIFRCRPGEFIRFKLKILEISQIANDILTIQFLTVNSQKRYYYDLRFINHFIKMNKWFYTNFPVMQVTFDARKIRPIGDDDDNKHVITPFNYNGLEMRVVCSANTAKMEYQSINLIIVGVVWCINKLRSQRGVKSTVMFILLGTTLIAIPLALIGTIIRTRQLDGMATGFKLIGSAYNQVPNYKSTELDVKDNSLDLAVLTSFNCSDNFPKFISDFIDDSFTQNHESILADMSTHHRYKDKDELLPSLLSTNTACAVDNECLTVMKYNKPYSLQLDLNNTQNKTLFYCCDPKLTAPIDDVCNVTETVIGGHRYNENPLLWDSVKTRQYFLLNLLRSAISCEYISYLEFALSCFYS